MTYSFDRKKFSRDTVRFLISGCLGMTRFLVFSLVFANLLFFAFARGYFGETTVSEPNRLAEQKEPDRLLLLWRPGEAPDGEAGEPAPETLHEAPSGGQAGAPGATRDTTIGGGRATMASASSPSATMAEIALTPSAQNPAPPARLCLLLEGLNDNESKAIARQAEADKLSIRWRTEGSWWVFIPPQSSREAADQKTGELRRLGVNDFFIVGEGAQRWAISLGVFSQEEGARRHLENLRGKGVRSARAEPRPSANGQDAALNVLEIQGDAAMLDALRVRLPARFQPLAPRACPLKN
jgi:hypothetical protein